ncbi:MAG: UbiA-like polyprenyltransferase [Mucinivorans sp.]
MINKILSLIKFNHTIFALPFALIGYFLGVRVAGFEWLLLLQVVLCMVFARSAAMAFNRLVDREFDAQNPRTATRELPSGALSTRIVRWFVVGSAVAFMLTALSINIICFLLSPLALAIVLGYSYTKRFTWFCHLILGLGLAIAPSGAYIATTGALAALPMLLSALVLTWVAGFDIIFALQDLDFDRSAKLHSIPARLGARGALITSIALHCLTLLFVILIGLRLHPTGELLYIIGSAIFAALLIFQHIIVRPTDLSRVGLAFGTTNGIASVLYAAFFIASLFVSTY